MRTRSIKDFFETDVTNYACYSTLRMIASSIDGLKNSSRKILHTALEKNIKNDVKVSVFDNNVQSFTQYLHGSCANVIQNMAADYVGSNNLPLLKGQGNFGSRFVNEPAAPRYIYVKNQEFINDLFDIKDVLISQYFEGSEIEPLFFVPFLPLILINGSLNGLASGFKQHILPRKLEDIVKYINNEKTELKPYIKGFKGDVRQVESENSNNVQWEFLGLIEINKNEVHIKEIPPFIEYAKYLEILENLLENKKIKSYKDLSNQKEQIFEFKVQFFDKINKEKALETLKLIKRETEIYNALDENNQVRTFNNVKEILDYYIDVRKRYMLKQQEFNIKKLEKELDIIIYKLKFIKLIIDNKLKIMKRSKKDIENDLEKLEFKKIDDNFDYLLRMQIHSFTNETLEKLTQEAKNVKELYETTKKEDTFKNYLKNINLIKKSKIGELLNVDR